jgi:hypothetical protein
MLYQSTLSDNCTVCAFANLLSLYGITMSRSEASHFLDSSKRSTAAVITHSLLLRAIGAHLPICESLGWKRINRFSFGRFSNILVNQNAPTLVTFHMRHKRKRWYGIHCVVATSASEFGIDIIDSLGRRNGQVPNATISAKERYGCWPVAGAPVMITKGSAFILTGLPSLPTSN